MRLILYTGKGGVGKSSLAAATAVRAAELGQRTLIVSSDMAHNLADIYDLPVGGAPTLVAANLTALEVDPIREIEDNWAPADDYFTNLLVYLGEDGIVAEEAALLPGVEDLFALTRILREIEGGDYDVVVVDCSPTAGALRHLTLTDTACTKIRKLVDVERKVLRLIRPVVHQFGDMRELMPSNDAYLAFGDILGYVGRLGAMLKDPDVSSIRLVLNPDRIALAETTRAFTYFGLFGFPIDGVFVNKVLPEQLAKGYMERWYGLQHELLEAIDRSFMDVAKLRAPLLGREPIGLEALSELAATVFGDRPPHEVLSESKTVSLSRVDGRTQLTFRLPLTDKADLDIDRRGDDLVLRAGAYSRVYALPDSLAGREVAEAGFKDGTLTISFLQQDAADRKVSPCNRALPDRPGSGTGDIRSQGG